MKVIFKKNNITTGDGKIKRWDIKLVPSLHYVNDHNAKGIGISWLGFFLAFNKLKGR